MEKLTNFWSSNDYLSKEELLSDFKILKDFAKIALPQTLVFFCFILQGFINTLFISYEYKSQDMLNAIGISFIYLDLTTGIIITGITGALETLASNAYGAKNFKLLGIYNDRCRAISIVFWIISSIFHFFFAKSILGLLNVNQAVVNLCFDYIKIFIFSSLFSINVHINTKMFVLIEKAHLNLFISILALIMNLIVSWFFICFEKCGIKGAAISAVVTSIFNLVVSTYMLHMQKLPGDALIYFTKESLQDWFSYIKVAFPVILISGGQRLGSEIQSMISIFISPLAYSTILITMHLSALSYPHTLGTSIAISMKAGEKIISETSTQLKKYITICYSFSVVLTIIVLIVIILVKDGYYSVMSPNREIYEHCLPLTGYIYWFLVVNGGYYFFIGVLKAVRYLKNPTIVSFVLCYVVEIGLTYFFAFKLEMEVKGIWLSNSIGTTFGFLIFLYWTYSFDMETIRETVLKGMEQDNKIILKTEMEIMNSKEVNDAKKELLSER